MSSSRRNGGQANNPYDPYRDDEVDLMGYHMLCQLTTYNPTKLPQHNCPYTGDQYVQFLLSGNPKSIRNQLYMEVTTFMELVKEIVRRNVVDWSNMKLSLAMFLFICDQSSRTRNARDQFQHSNRHFVFIMRTLGNLASFIIQPPNMAAIPPEIRYDRRYWPWFKEQIGVSQQQALVSVTTEAAQTKSHNQLQSPGCLTSSPELSPTSVTQSISSAPSPTLLDKKLSPVVNTNSALMPHVEKHDSANPKPISSVRVVKTPSTDGYNWRKYGQKQVKSPQGSRSYYKCTFCDCLAKKIECCDHSNRVIEIISKGQHNHDPPWRINCTRASRLALPAAPNSTVHPVRMLNDSDPSTSSRELIQETPVLPETKQQDSIGSDGSTEIDIKEEHVDEPEPKRRLKKSNSSYSGSSFKPGKKPKFIVHAAGDVGISGDGYRWRKYGQKMVKGNPHPRNYYRCTSAGCPVRKHIERAVDNTTAVIITYKGIHDHDMPVPKKRHGPPSAPLVAAAAPASMNLQFKKTEAIANQISATQWSVDTEGELTSETLDTGEEKAMESARTLLSIGFEIKQC